MTRPHLGPRLTLRQGRGWLLGLLCLGVLLLAPLSHAAVLYQLVDAQTINGTGTYTSSIADLWHGAYFGAWYLCTSVSGAPNVMIEWLESPTTEATDFVTVVTLVAALTAETPQLIPFFPPPMRYGQVKVTGNAGNPADTVCTVKVFVQGPASQ